MNNIAHSFLCSVAWPLLAGGVATTVGCTANVGEPGSESVEPAAGTAVETTSEALFAAPSKTEIDAYAKAHGFPQSDYPYYEAANGCGNDWYVSILPQSLPRADMGFAPTFPPSPSCRPGKSLSAIPLNDACNGHDHCYVTLGSDKATCDKSFLNSLQDACKSNLSADPMIPCPPFVPPVIVDPVTAAALLVKSPFVKHSNGDLARCNYVAGLYYSAVRDFGAQYFGPSQQKAADYKALVDTFINTRRYGVCTGDISCTRAPKTLHRMTLSCSGTPIGVEQVVALTSSNSSNVKCVNRYQAQCIDDNTFDSYFVEWCDYASPQCNYIATKVYACDPGAPPPNSTCKPTKLHRIQYSCKGEPQSKEQVVDLVATGYANYTCTNRFKDQCVSDGTWDSYWSEWCEYTCP